MVATLKMTIFGRLCKGLSFSWNWCSKR